MKPEREYCAIVLPVGEAPPWTLPDGWEYAGGCIRQGEGYAETRVTDGPGGELIDRLVWDDGAPTPFQLVTYIRPQIVRSSVDSGAPVL